MYFKVFRGIGMAKGWECPKCGVLRPNEENKCFSCCYKNLRNSDLPIMEKVYRTIILDNEVMRLRKHKNQEIPLLS